MLNKDELIFAVDENNHPINPVPRKTAHREGIWHRTTDVAVVNSNNELLCHKRSQLKDTGPGLWDACFGGHMLAGMNPISSALDELKEESGLDVVAEDLDFVTIVKFDNKKNKEFRYLYIYKWDGEIKKLNLEKDEIDEAKWISKDIIKNNRDNQLVWVPMPHLDYLLKRLEDK